jgi:anaphase-promoting complex subunit 10
LINIHFRRKMPIVALCIYADFKADESYTPSRISVRSGTHAQDLEEKQTLELFEPSGWTCIDLTHAGYTYRFDSHGCHRTTRAPEEGGSSRMPLRTFMLQLAILGNHQNGRDTHIRQIKVFAAAASSVGAAVWSGLGSDGVRVARCMLGATVSREDQEKEDALELDRLLAGSLGHSQAGVTPDPRVAANDAEGEAEWAMLGSADLLSGFSTVEMLQHTVLR